MYNLAAEEWEDILLSGRNFLFWKVNFVFHKLISNAVRWYNTVTLIFYEQLANKLQKMWGSVWKLL